MLDTGCSILDPGAGRAEAPCQSEFIEDCPAATLNSESYFDKLNMTTTHPVSLCPFCQSETSKKLLSLTIKLVTFRNKEVHAV